LCSTEIEHQTRPLGSKYSEKCICGRDSAQTPVGELTVLPKTQNPAGFHGAGFHGTASQRSEKSGKDNGIRKGRDNGKERREGQKHSEVTCWLQS